MSSSYTSEFSGRDPSASRDDKRAAIGRQNRDATWRVLIAEPDAALREALVNAIKDLRCAGRRVEAEAVSTVQEARELLAQDVERSVCLFSASQTEASEWLELARWMREEGKKMETRVAIRADAQFLSSAERERLDLSDHPDHESGCSDRLLGGVAGLIRSYSTLAGARASERAMSSLAEASQALSACKTQEAFADELSQRTELILGSLECGAALLDQVSGVEGGSRRALINAPPLSKVLMWADLKKAEPWQLAGFEALRACAQSAYAAVALSRRLESFSHTDPITGLANRRSFSESLEKALAPGAPGFVGVAIYDLDHFKMVNDRMGHHAGDRLLAHVGTRMSPLRKEGRCEPARLGADEFAALFIADTADGVKELARQMFEAIMRPVSAAADRVSAEVSGGLSILKASEGIPSEALRQADLALYQAKREGRGRLRLYEGQAGAGTKSERSLRFEQGLAGGELELHYQPKVRLSSGALEGFEALVRWRHPVEGLIPPMEFLPMAQELGLMDQLDLWVARAATQQCLAWQEQGLTTNIYVNLAPEHMQNKPFMTALIGIFKRQIEAAAELGGEAGRMGAEIVESSALSDVESARAVIKELRDMGLRVALDDFGTGYSSLSYLRKLPLDELKIDQSFVRAMLSNPEDFQIVQSVVQLAGIFGLSTVAEGVENAEVARELLAIGCDVAQGYGIARPMPAERALEWARSLEAGGELADWAWLAPADTGSGI